MVVWCDEWFVFDGEFEVVGDVFGDFVVVFGVVDYLVCVYEWKCYGV